MTLFTRHRRFFLHLTCLFIIKSSSTTFIIVFNGPKRRPCLSPIINICHHDKHLFKQQIRCYTDVAPALQGGSENTPTGRIDEAAGFSSGNVKYNLTSF